jgi:xylitol oxidase
VEPRANWAGNVRFRAASVHRPASVAEVQQIVARSPRVRALGTGHSFSPVADTTGDLVSLAGLPPVIEVDTLRRRVSVSAGLRYTDLARRLNAAGLALANLASLPHISVAGAVATATHGSGDANQCLASAVCGLELVTGGGDLITVTRDADPSRFPGMVVALGALGIVTRLTLDAGPAFRIGQWVQEDVPFDAVTASFAEIMAAAYSVSIFTDWNDRRLAVIWLKRAVLTDPQLTDPQLTGPQLTGPRPADPQPADPPAEGWLGGRLADGPRHPVPGQPADATTPQGGRPGPWHERLPHFRPDSTPSAGNELQSEFLLARSHAVPALAALDAMRAELAPVVQVSEVRSVAADDLWLSPFYQRDSVGLHFTWVADAGAVAPVLARVEAALAPFAPRPHWGKISTIAAGTVASRYPRLDDFRRLAAEYDAAASFRNEMVDDYVFA